MRDCSFRFGCKYEGNKQKRKFYVLALSNNKAKNLNIKILETLSLRDLLRFEAYFHSRHRNAFKTEHKIRGSHSHFLWEYGHNSSERPSIGFKEEAVIALHGVDSQQKPNNERHWSRTPTGFEIGYYACVTMSSSFDWSKDYPSCQHCRCYDSYYRNR